MAREYDYDAAARVRQPDYDAAARVRQPDYDAAARVRQPDYDAAARVRQPDYDAAARVRQPDYDAAARVRQPDYDAAARVRQPDYDAVVIGSGAAGGIVAAILAESGKHVLLLERGRALNYNEIPRDHVRNHRLSLYGHNTGPELDGFPRVWADSRGERPVRPHEGAYMNIAMTLGGGTRVYGAQAWRFMPQDFRMASVYGVPEGSSLADWPIGYDDLAPHYERAEWEIGVAGDGAASVQPGLAEKGYPLPPPPDSLTRRALVRGAKGLGWRTQPVPLLINTAPYNGRAACIHCQHCVGHACPTDAKSGTQNTMIPRALATGHCDLLTGAMAERIEVDARGDVAGVSYVVEADGRIERRRIRSKAVVVSGGAVESARLLLNSSSPKHPGGLGNAHDQVGRNLQGHFYSGAYGLMDEPVFDGIGPGPNIATCQFSHGSDGIIGGGMLANEFVKQPLLSWYWSLPPDLPRWGEANKRWMRDNFKRVMQVQGPTQEIPVPDARVTVAPNVRDRYGVPVARFSGSGHPESAKASEYLRERAREWLIASGAVRTWVHPEGPIRARLSGGQHQAGTCRMGTDPRSSVADSWGRVHGHDNLFVVDGSLHVTNGGFNPVLTIMALAFRCGEHIAETL